MSYEPINIGENLRLLQMGVLNDVLGRRRALAGGVLVKKWGLISDGKALNRLARVFLA